MIFTRNVLVFFSLFILFAGTSLNAGEEKTDAVSVWNQEFLNAVESSSTAPGLAARNLAILHAALHDGVSAIRGNSDAFLVNVMPEQPISEEAFVEIIGARMMDVFYPSYKGHTRQLLKSRLAPYAPDSIAAAENYAEKVMKAAFRARASDGAANTLTYIPKDGPGKWRRTPPHYRPPELSHWYNVTPFVLPSAEIFRPPPPPDLKSPEYAENVNQVKEWGALRSRETRSEEQTHVANFWSCFSYTSTPAGHWNLILGDILRRRKETDFLFIARAYALLAIAQADAGIAAWECKYHYEFWRPVQAIHDADKDNNPATEMDAGWESLLESPPHPEYVSGHSAFSGAGARMLAHIFGTDDIAFSAQSSSFPDAPRTYNSLWTCAEECGISRIYGGIHFPFSNREGLELGKKVADYVFANAN